MALKDGPNKMNEEIGFNVVLQPSLLLLTRFLLTKPDDGQPDKQDNRSHRKTREFKKPKRKKMIDRERTGLTRTSVRQHAIRAPFLPSDDG